MLLNETSFIFYLKYEVTIRPTVIITLTKKLFLSQIYRYIIVINVTIKMSSRSNGNRVSRMSKINLNFRIKDRKEIEILTGLIYRMIQLTINMKSR